MSSVDSITITNTDVTNQIEITSTDGITVTTVGTQGLAGPSAIMSRGLDQTTATSTNNGALLVYDHGNEKWTASNTTAAQSLTQIVYNLQLGGGGATVTTILDEDNMSSDSATALATQQSIKAYVDNNNTNQDLDIRDDDGNLIDIRIDSEVLQLLGGDGMTSNASGVGVTFAVDSTVARLSAAQTFTNKTLTSPVLNGSLSGTAFLDEDNFSSNSAVAVASQQSIKAYVDAAITAEDLDITDGSNTGAIDLDSETLGILGGTGLTSSLSGNNITLAIDSSVATLTGTQTLTNKTLTAPVIATISNSGTLTLPTGAETLVGRATTDTLTNKTLTAPTINSPKLNGSTTVTTTGAELNILDGDASASSVVIVDADQIIVNDNGTMKQVAVTRLDTYVSGTTQTLTNKTLTSPVLNGTLSGNAFLDEDDMSSNSATKAASQQSIKAYVDAQLTAQDLDVSDGSNDISIDLDSESLTLAGGTGITSTANTNTVTFAIDGTVATLAGSQTLTNKTIDVDNNTVSNIEVDNLKSGVLDTDLSSVAATDTTIASAKAIKTYVDAQVTAQDLDISDGSNDIAIDLDSETLSLLGGTGVTSTASNNGVTFAIGQSVGTSDNVQFGTVTAALSGNASTATALETARTIGGVSFDGTANINLAGVNATGNQDTSGNAATATALATGRTIALAGDVTASGVSFDGTGNISLTTTIAANSVALGTDTTGDYVGTITGGTGIDSTGATSGEGIAHTLSLDLNELTTETTIADDDFIAMVDATDSASGKITFENLEDAIFSSVSGDIAIAEDGTATIQANSVALSTDTTGNYVAGISGTTNEIEVSGSGSEGATVTIGLPDNVTISGNLTVNGTTTTTDTNELHVNDPLIKLAKDNTANSIDIGFYGQYRASGSNNQFTGLFRDQNDSGKYKLFELLEAEPTTTVNTSGTGYQAATLVANFEGPLTGNASTATTLATARAIALSGDVVGTANFDGSAGISISTTIQANSVALGTDTTGNYVSTIAGTSNEIEVSGSGSETAAVTIGLPSATEITTSLGVGGGSTNGVVIEQGAIKIKNGGTQSNILFYCESSNAHYVKLQAPAHSAFSGNPTLTLPATTGTIVGSGDSGTVSNSMLANSSVNFGGVTLALGASDTTPAFNLQDATGYPTSSLTGTITNAQLAGSIANAKLANSTVSFGGISLALGASDATPAFDLSDATNYPTSSLSGTITNAQLAGSIANAKLANSSITVGDGSNTTAVALGGTITYAAGEGLDVAESSGTITYSAEDATSSNKGIASFTGDFSVSSGAVSLGASGVTAASYGSATAVPVIAIDAKGRITSASTAAISTSFTLSDGSNTQTISGGDTLTVAGTSNEVDVAVSATDTLTIGLPNDVTVSNNLTVSGNLTVTGTTTQTGSVVTDNNFTGLTNANTGNATDFGFYGKYVVSSTTKYAGIYYDASDSGTFKIFKDTQTAPSTTVNSGATGYAAADLAIAGLTTTGITLGGTAITSTGAELNILDGVTSTTAELNILDGVTATTAEINILDGDTSATSTTLADADRVVVNDNGTMKQVALTDFETYFESALDTLNNVTSIGTLGSLTVSGDVTIDTNTLKVDSSNNRVGIGNASPDVSLDIGSNTDAIHVPVGTTSQRPNSPAAGYFRYNSTTSKFEGYTDEWGEIAGGGGGSAMETDNFTGDGSTTAFTLSSSVASEDNLLVFIEGVFQNKGDYVASGTTLTFDTAPANTRKIVVFHVKSSINGASMVQDSFTGNGSTTAYTLSSLPNNENNTFVYIDGVYQHKDTYSTSGTTLTFSTAPANSAAIEVMMFMQTAINVPASNSVTTSTIADGNVTTAKINDDAVTLAKMAGLARGKLIVGDSSGNPSALALGSANYVLTSDGNDVTWAASQVEESPSFTGNVAVGGTLGVTGQSTLSGIAYPTSDGSNGQVLQTNGSGTLSFATVSGGASSIDGLSDAKTFGTGSIMLGDTTTGTLSNANYNIGVGVDMLHSLTSGYANIAIGFESCKDLTTGHNNVAVGHATLYENISGEQNVAIGSNALQNNTTGDYNVAVGKSAMSANTTTHYSVGVGFEALKSEATSGSNVAIGGLSMMTSNGASNNVAVGKQTGYLHTTGDYNVWVGSNCGFNSTTSEYNVGVGYTALYSCTTGSELVGIGPKALYSATTAVSCIAIGDRAFEDLIDSPYNIAIGYKSGQNFETGASNEGSCTFVGDSSGRSVTSGKQNTFIGAFAGHVTVGTTTGYRNTVVGSNAHCNAADGNKEIVMGFATTGIGNGYTTLGSDTARTYNQQGSATWTGTSDERLKENITNLSNSLSFINDLRPVTFNWKTLGSIDTELPIYREGSDERYQQVDGDLPRAGFIAQEVKTVIDNHSEIPSGQKIWHQAPDGIQGTAEGELIPYLVKAIQELSAKNDALTARIETLEG